jgi:hypothetical protein
MKFMANARKIHLLYNKHQIPAAGRVADLEGVSDSSQTAKQLATLAGC